MTNDQPARGNDTVLPAIKAHVAKIQDRACLLTGLIEAINYIEDQGGCENGRFTISVIAQELASEIYQSLDTVELAKLEAEA